MLEIRNSAGQTLQLPVDSKLSIEILSTILTNDEVLRGSYSYPFRFGLTEGNRRFIGSGMEDIPVSVTAGTYSFRATMGYRITGLYADGYLMIDLGAVADTIRNTSLRMYITERVELGSSLVTISRRLLDLAKAEPGENPIVFPPFRNDAMVDPDFEAPATYIRPTLINRFQPGLQSYIADLEGTGGKSLLVPMVYLVWLIRTVCKKLGFQAQGSLLNDPDLRRAILFNTQTLPGITPGAGSYTVEISRHLPDITLGEFFRALRTSIGCGITFNATTRIARFNTYRSIRTQADYVDISHGIIPDQEGMEPPERQGYQINSHMEDTDQLLKERPYRSSYRIGSGQQPVDLSIGTLMMNRDPNYDADGFTSWMIPYCKQPGNLANSFFKEAGNYSPYYDTSDPAVVPPLKNGFGLRLLLYWGMQPDASGKLYPYAASVSYNAKYQEVGTLALLPGEPNDLYSRYQQIYYESLAFARKLSVPMLLSLSKLSQISPDVPLGIRMKNFTLGRYILNKLTYELPAQDGYVLAKLEARQIVAGPIRPNVPEPELYTAVWVQLVLENPTTEESFSDRKHYADVVLYFWLDGAHTAPVEPASIQINYSSRTEEYDDSGNATPTTDNRTATAFGHRYVLHTQALVSYEEEREEGMFYVATKFHHTLQPGPGYRI